MTKICFLCSNSNQSEIVDVYGYDICHNCRPTLGLLKDDTISKHVASYAKKQIAVPENPNYKEEVDYRLQSMETDYVKKRLKLLHIQARLKLIIEPNGSD